MAKRKKRKGSPVYKAYLKETVEKCIRNCEQKKEILKELAA